jgi:hypothetical protein
VKRAAEGGERSCHHHRFVDERARPLLEPSLQPAAREPARPRPVAERHERGQLERLAEVEPARLACLELRADEVAALDRPPKGGPRVALGSRVRTPFLGPEQWRA